MTHIQVRPTKRGTVRHNFTDKVSREAAAVVRPGAFGVIGKPQSFVGHAKKVRIPRLHGLVPGEIAFRDFPFRVKESLK